MSKRIVIVVLGNQLDERGRVVPWFKDRLRTGLHHLRELEGSVMVITGGQTRAGFPSEAEVGKEYLLSGPIGVLLREKGYEKRILVETEARSTSDHPELVRQVLEKAQIDGSCFVFVTSEHHVLRSKYLFRRFWPESQKAAIWVPVLGHSSVKDWVLEAVFYLIDQCPPLANWLKRRYRNAAP